MDSILKLVYSTGSTGLLFVLSHFPEGNEKIKSA